MEWLFDSQVWIGLITLTALEIVLGIDNVIFISILADKLPPESRDKARRLGLSLALIMRILLLFSLTWVMGLTRPLLTVFGFAITGRALILILGGLFLLAKSTREIHHNMEDAARPIRNVVVPSLGAALVQIALLDVVFSLDSVITAVGMVDKIWVMIAAVIISIAIMMIFAGAVARFIERHPTLKMLALSFLILIGVNLIGEGLGFHIPKGYTYFAMGFSFAVEMLNIRIRKRRQ